MNQVASFKCPNCGSPITYKPTGELKCDNCDTVFTLEALQKLEEWDQPDAAFDWSEYKNEFEKDKEKMQDTAVYLCQFCGAEIETDTTTSATHCPYCDNVVILADRLTGGLRPNAIIPFAIDKKGLEDVVRNYFKGKPYLPPHFADEQKMSEIRGLYVPFWLFDGGLDGQMLFEGTKTRVYADSKYNYTEVSHYQIGLDGAMRFEKVPVDASTKLDDDLMDSVEPFDFSGLVDFDPAYLSGYVADRFNENPDESLPRAEKRMRTSAAELFRRELSDFSAVTQKTSTLALTDPKLKYVLLPMYLLNLKYKDKDYRFAVNGQTGKIVGELPVCKWKKRLLFWGLTLGIAALVTLFLIWINRM